MIKSLYKSIKFGFQRMFRYYDDSAYWSLDLYLTKIIIPVLKFYKDEGIGYPGTLTEKQWDNKLNKMIIAFTLIEKGNWQILTKKEIKLINEGLKEFADYYMNLWD